LEQHTTNLVPQLQPRRPTQPPIPYSLLACLGWGEMPLQRQHLVDRSSWSSGNRTCPRQWSRRRSDPPSW